MASVMAVVAKAAFEKQAPKGLAAGGTWALDRYVSKTPALRALEGGGALFLVTVRPPDERLWLVAVLESPTFDGVQWTAAPNVVPVVDVTHLLPELRFASGKGVAAQPGKLGMSLQTPRELSDEDVALLRGASGAKANVAAAKPKREPAKKDAAVATSVADPVPRALALLRGREAKLAPATAALLEPILALAATSASKAAAGAKALAKKLGNTEEAIAVYDAAAAAILEHGTKSRAAAGDCHGAARAIERKLKLASKPDDAVAVAAGLATAGAVWVKELVLLAKEVKKEKRADLAGPLARAAIETVRAGETPTGDLVAALDAVGAEHAEAALATWIVAAPAQLAAAEGALWEAAARPLAAIAEHLPGVATWAATFRPDTRDTFPWLSALVAAKLPERLAVAHPELARPFAETLLFLSTRHKRAEERTSPLARALPPLVAAMRARGEALELLAPPLWGTRRPDFYAPHVAELLLSLDAPLVLEGDEVARGVFQLYEWAHLRADAPYQTLERIGAHPVLGRRLVESLERAFINTDFASIVAKAAACAGTRAAVLHLATEVVGRGLVAEGTLGAFHGLYETLGRMCQPAVLAACPALGEAILAIEPAHLLWNQLRGGLMDEWGWPALDEAAERLGGTAPMASSAFPNAFLMTDDRLVVVGPDGVLLDRTDASFSTDYQWLRYGAWVSGDAFLVAGDYEARWVLGGERFARADPRPLFDPLTGDPPIKEDGTPFRRGDHEFDWNLQHRIALFDGKVLYGNGTGRDWKHYRAMTGEVIGEGLPPFLAERLGVAGETELAFLRPVPARAVRSPLGAKDGVAGFVYGFTKDGRAVAEGIDGRAVEPFGDPSYHHPQGIVTFPERDGYALVSSGWVHVPGSRVALLATNDDDGAGALWGGGPLRLPIEWWSLMLPRDPAGSRALAACTLERASALFRAAAGANASADEAPAEAESEIRYADLRVIVKPAKDDGGVPEPLVRAARAAFPEVTHPRLLAGIGSIAGFAVVVSEKLRDLQARVAAAKPGGTAQSGLRNADVTALDPFFHASFDLPGRWGQDRLGQQIHDAATFLFGDRPPVPAGERPAIVTPAACFVEWERVLFHGRELVLALLGAATPPSLRAQVRTFVELWRATPFATETARVRLVGLAFARAPAHGLSHDSKDRLVEWENRYLLRLRELGETDRAYRFAAVEVTRDGTFRVPPGATVEWTQALDAPLDARTIDAALALLDARGPAPFDAAAAATLAEKTGMLRETAALLLGGAHLADPDKDGRATLGIPVKRVAYARLELGLPALHAIASGAVPDDVADVYRPDALAERLASRWIAANGRHAPLATEILERMEDDVRHPHPPFLAAARALQDPDALPLLTKDATWVHRPFSTVGLDALRFGSVPNAWPQHHDEPEASWARQWPDAAAAFSYETLGRFLKYLAWAYLELPVGDPLRRGAGRMAALLDERLRALGLLVPVAMGPIEDRAAFDAFASAKGAAPYRAADGGPSAAGIEQGGVVVVFPDDAEKRDGVFVSLRPGGLGANVDVPGVKLTTFPYLRMLRLWRTPGFQAIAGDLRAPRLPDGTFVANPLASAPDAVRAVREAQDLSEDAAVLWLEIRALAEPTPARVARYQGWSLARHTAAAAELVNRGLVVDAAQRGTTRTLFLPGPRVTFDRYPAPVEQAKLEAYALVAGEVPVLDVPLPVRPVEELYRAAAAAPGA